MTDDTLKNIKSALQEKRLTYVGYVNFPIPVYLIHMTYMAKDDDPLFPLDKALMRLIWQTHKKTVAFDVATVAAMFHFEPEFIRSRIKRLMRLRYVEIDEQGLSYRTSEVGERIFFEAEERPLKSYDFEYLVDGKRLRQLPDAVYSGKAFYGLKKENDTCPYFNESDANIGKVAVERLESCGENAKRAIGVKCDANNFASQEAKQVTLCDIAVVFYMGNGLLKRQLYFRSTPIEIESLAEDVSRVKLALCASSLKVSVAKQADDQELVGVWTKAVEKYANSCFHENDCFQEQNVRFRTGKGSDLPISFEIGSQLFERLGNRRAMIQNIRNGWKRLSIVKGDNETGELMAAVMAGDDCMERLMEVDEQISKKTDKFMTLKRKDLPTLPPFDFDWQSGTEESQRQWIHALKLLQRFDVLEAIDMNTYL